MILIVNFDILAATLPRTTTKATDADLTRPDKPGTTASTTSLYDNVTASSNQQGQLQNSGIIYLRYLQNHLISSQKKTFYIFLLFNVSWIKKFMRWFILIDAQSCVCIKNNLQ